jgi:hypothetical protein
MEYHGPGLDGIIFRMCSSRLFSFASHRRPPLEPLINGLLFDRFYYFVYFPVLKGLGTPFSLVAKNTIKFGIPMLPNHKRSVSKKVSIDTPCPASGAVTCIKKNFIHYRRKMPGE